MAMQDIYKTVSDTLEMKQIFHQIINTLDRIMPLLQSQAMSTKDKNETAKTLKEYIEIVMGLEANRDITMELTQTPDKLILRRRYPNPQYDNSLEIELKDDFECKCYETRLSSSGLIKRNNLLGPDKKIVDANFIAAIETLHLPSEKPKQGCCIS